MTKALKIDGVDLSHFQEGKINWAQAKDAGVKFVYHKATEGRTFVDPAFAARRQEVRENGLPFGAYHFARVENSPESEAAHFLSVYTADDGDMIPMLDLEVNSPGLGPDALAEWVAKWFAAVFAKTGHAGGFLYTPFDISHKPKGVHLWVARYSDSNSSPVVRKPFRTWMLWQFSDGRFGVPHSVPGIGGVDANTFHRTLGIRWHRLSSFRLPVKRRKRKVKKPVTQPTPPKVRLKPTPIEKLLHIAAGEVGYHEGHSNGHWNNIQKFSPAVPGLEWSQGQAWCATFVSWCVMKAGLADLFPRTASTDTGAGWFKQRGQWHEYPAIGAQVFFGHNGDMNHTGLVYDYDDTFVYTIEGNTNTNGSNEGDGVYRKKRLRRDDYVQGYGYPAVPGGLKSADPNYHRSAA